MTPTGLPMADVQPDAAGTASADQALAGGAPQRVGWFRFYFDGERWEWSDEVRHMHGYPSGTVNPTTEIVLSHKHPDDFAQVAATLDDIRRTHRAFSTRHRIVDTARRVRDVIVVGDQMFGNDGDVIGTYGFYVDVTPSPKGQDDLLTAAVAEIAENRAAIEQVKGMLMMVYGIDADRAFEILKWRSQETNTKLRRLAEQLRDDFASLSHDEHSPTRATYDQLLLTAHQRIDRTA